MDDDIYVAGGVEIPDHMLDHDIIHFENAPEDDLSRLILQLIGLHLKKWSDEQKCQIITAIHTVLGIRPMNATTIATMTTTPESGSPNRHGDDN